MALDPQQKGCCPPGSLGAALAADPKSLRGENVELHSPSQGKVVAYVSKPPADAPSKPGQCLLVLHDVFGVDSGRTKQICDSYATKGYTVILPDLTRDGSFEPPESFGLGVFKTIFKAISHLYNNTRGPVLARLDEAVLPYLYNELGAKQIALMCFCWGAFPMNHLLGKHLPEIKCAIGFHPSLQLSSLYFENLDSILESIQVPIAYLSAENDPATIRPEGVAHKIMQKKPFAEECIFKEYKGVRHGWVNRGDLKDPTVLEAYTDSIKLSDEFLEKHLLSSAL